MEILYLDKAHNLVAAAVVVVVAAAQVYLDLESQTRLVQESHPSFSSLRTSFFFCFVLVAPLLYFFFFFIHLFISRPNKRRRGGLFNYDDDDYDKKSYLIFRIKALIMSRPRLLVAGVASHFSPRLESLPPRGPALIGFHFGSNQITSIKRRREHLHD